MTHGLFLFQIHDVFYRIGLETINIRPNQIDMHVKQLLEEKAYDTYHSLMWREAENIALSAFKDGYRHNGRSHY